MIGEWAQIEVLEEVMGVNCCKTATQYKNRNKLRQELPLHRMINYSSSNNHVLTD